MTAPAPTATVLIVDDTPDNITVLFDFLAERGFKVLVGENGEAALEALEVEEPDLILLDVMMPGLDGLETCRRLKALPAGRDVPVFFMTALGDPYDKVRGLEAGAVDYLTKPVYPEEVLARIRAHLEIRQLQKSLQEQNERLDAALQRSITAERALQTLLDEPVLLARAFTHELLFATAQARTLIDLLGGEAELARLLAADAEHAPLPDGRRLLLHRGATSQVNQTELVTLRVQSRAATPDDLRSLGLTPREAEMLFWIAQGKTSPEIAIILNTQVCTVKKHVGNLLPKLGVETRLAAALLAQTLLQRGD
ncbi:response regulator [Spirulina sp. CCNP1310]|uniref:response regulator n=1 Tax=Spirulina sp. CCNP1310 TaxID=3110249 RepID=UPI002B219032|nr:response regulator [Spirulina sp. CCNP1310]MEA5421548.1 response regulator [Spirulina sp. CCNP1310]